MLTKQELTQVEGQLYEPARRKQSLSLRLVVSVNRTFMPFARAIAYKSIEGMGKARVRKAGSRSKDYQFVGEEVTSKTQPTYDVDAAIEWNKDEVEEARAAASMGRGPLITVDQYRIRTAQRVVDEGIDRVGFIGAPDGEVPGLLNYPKIQSLECKKPFSSLKPPEILKELLKLKSAARFKGVFNPKVLAVHPDIKDLLDQPMSDLNTQTVMQWLSAQGGMMPKVIEVKELSKEYNGLTGDAIMMFDNDPSIVEFSLLRDLEMSAPFQTDFDEWRIMVRSKTGGIILREEKAVAVMVGV